LDNLIGSIIVLDEVQSIPFEYWGAVRSVLRFLSERFNVRIIMMTATQPLIFNHEETNEIAPIEILGRLPQRVSFCTKTNKSIRLHEFCEEAAKIMEDNKTKSILFELNTIQNSVQVYKALKSRLLKSSSSCRPTPFDGQCH
jgi:CRISPR-associated endonuclease/helicase Cas3